MAGAIIGGALGLGGSLISANATKKAAKTAANAAKFVPYNTSNLFGSTNWYGSPAPAAGSGSGGQLVTTQPVGGTSKKRKKGVLSNGLPASVFDQLVSTVNGAAAQQQRTPTLDMSLSPFSQQIADAYQARALAGLNDPLSEAGRLGKETAAGDIFGAYNDAQNFGLDPNLFGAVTGGYADLLSRGTPMVDSTNVRANTGLLRGLYGDVMGNNPAETMMGYGADLLGNSYGDVANSQLDLMRQQAAPYEKQQTDSLFQRLFNQGRMGSTGGGRDIEAFARGLGQADVQRQLSANDFARGLYAQDQGTGANLLSGGVSGMLQGKGLAANIGQNIGQLGLTAAMSNQDNSLRAGMANQQGILSGNAQDANILGALGNFGMNWNNTNYSRANDRIARAEALFGFGNQLANTGDQETGKAMEMLSALTGQQMDLANLGIAAGGAQASAGANAGRFLTAAAGSPVGSFFQGLGGSILSSDAAQNYLGGLFSSSPKPTPSIGMTSFTDPWAGGY